MAAIYHRSQADRKAGRGPDAARLLEEAARRYPGDPGIQVLVLSSEFPDNERIRKRLQAVGE